MSLLSGAVIGFLLGLIWCYYKQLKAVSDNRGLIGAATDFGEAAGNLWDHLRQSPT